MKLTNAEPSLGVPQTVLWVGDRDSEWVQPTYELAENVCSQVAWALVRGHAKD